MTIFVGILVFLVILACLIFIHELGHFFFAKLMGVRVDEFGLGFPPRLKTWRRGDTLYSLNAIPLGGFVKMQGENGDAEQPDSFGAKPPWQRLIILVAGPSMNLLLAITIFFFFFLGGSPRGITIITTVEKHSPAAAAGLRVGDRIEAVDGRPVTYFDDLRTVVKQHRGQRLYLVIQRGSAYYVTSLIPRTHPPSNQGAMGIVLQKSVTVPHTPGQAFHQALSTMGAIVTGVPNLLQSISQHDANGVSGPIGIAHDTTVVVSNEPQQGIGTVFFFAGILSASLGILNLLPIPALDGGRIIFVLLAWIRRRNLDPEVEGLIHLVGMAALLILILFISYHDVAQWTSGKPF